MQLYMIHKNLAQLHIESENVINDVIAGFL